MCGIGVVISKDPNRLTNVKNIMKRIRHRGPDSDGFFSSNENGISLGHARLSIIDLSQRGDQPMMSRDGSVVIVFNGEIYNYIEIREDLQQKGYRFKSQSDTEVIINSYIEWGDQCVNRFNGMWAFALYDQRRKRVFCSRDRFGIKPFYYTQIKDEIFICSEIKGLLWLIDDIKPDYDELYRFFSARWTDSSVNTMFKQVKQLRPSHNLTIDLAKGHMQEERYWDIKVKQKIQYDKDSVNQFRKILFDAVKIRLRSDVEVGCTLSGGLDSSTIVSIMDKVHPNGFDAFSAIYDTNDPYDERKFAEKVIARSGKARINWIRPRYDHIVKDINALIFAQEEPIADGSMFAHYKIMQHVKAKGIKVILSGQGGDEILGGYGSDLSVLAASFLKEGRLLSSYQLLHAMKKSNPSIMGDTIFHLLPCGIKSRIRTWFDKKNLAGLFNKEFLSGLDYRISKRYSCTRPVMMTDLDFFMYQTMRSWALPSFLHYDDRNSMAFGIETRVPFLDYRIVEFMFSLTDDAKISGGFSKRILRDATVDLLPQAVRLRKDKQAFYAPIHQWIDKLIEINNESIMDAIKANNIIFKDFKTIGELGFEKMDIYLKWKMLTFAIWYDLFFMRKNG